MGEMEARHLGEGKVEEGLDWCLGDTEHGDRRCLGPSTVIVLLYAIGCIVFGLTVGVTVMTLERRRARKRKSSLDEGAETKTDGRTRTMSETSELSLAMDLAESEGKFTGRMDDMRGMQHRRDSRASHHEDHSRLEPGQSPVTRRKNLPTSPLAGQPSV